MTSIPDAGSNPASPYPFFGTERAYRLALQAIPTRDLQAEIEAARWLALDLADDPGSRAIAESQLESLVDELLRRQRLLKARANDPLRPAWVHHEPDLRARVDTVKAAWPIDRFCTDVLGVILTNAGRNRWKASCPLPGHDDLTPSFVVYGNEDRAWCYGCNRGGDVIALAGYVIGSDRFFEKLEYLEGLSGVAGRAA